MTKPTFEYVMSAMAMARITMKYDDKPFYPEYCSLLHELTNSTQARVNAIVDNSEHKISCLYNAYTEASHGKEFTSSCRKKNGCDSLYADSGGLQIITRGLKITPELKTKVYINQSPADYAFCFDTIPLRVISAGSSKSSRTDISNKMFSYVDLEDCAKQTSRDIIEQLEYFDKHDSPTKVMIIVQGNTWQDMAEWFDHIIKEIPIYLRDRVGGIALADTCIGNGQLESIEMLRALRAIYENHGPKMVQHVHLLGVGSISRMSPVISLMNSGYIDFVKRLSYDSTSHTAGAYMGKLFEDGNLVKVSTYRCARTDAAFTRIYERHQDFISKHISIEKFLECVYRKPVNGLSDQQSWNTTHTVRYRNPDNNWETACAVLIPYMWVLYSVENFVRSLDKSIVEKKTKDNPLYHLERVKTNEDFDNWYAAFSRIIDSNRISRELSNLEDFFEYE